MVRLLLLVLLLGWSSCDKCVLDGLIPCPPLPPCPDNTTQIAATPNATFNCSGQTLSLQADQLLIQGIYTALSLSGNNIILQNVGVIEGNLTVIASQSLFLLGTISVSIGYLMASPSNSSTTSYLNISQASITTVKLVMIGFTNLWVDQSIITTTMRVCLYTSLNINSISTNVSKMFSNLDIVGLSQMNFTLFLMSPNEINLGTGTQIYAATVAIFSQNNVIFNNIIINSTAKSCRPNSGKGIGAVVHYQNLMCTSGSSSCGYGSLSNPHCQDIIQYFQFLSHSFPYISKGPFLNTGSGGYGYTSLAENGAGGGIIFILSNQSTTIEQSQILSQGGDVWPTDALSAGSGGSIFITSNYIKGVGLNNISAAGGASYNNNGSGSGGLVKISFVNVQAPSGSLWVNINEGFLPSNPTNQAYSNGIFYGPLCSGGQESYYLGCQPCQPGYYSTLGDPICRACPTSNEYSFNYSATANSFITNCFNQKHGWKLLDWLLPGDISILSMGLYLASLVIFGCVGWFLKSRIKKQKLSSQNEFKLQDVKRDVESAKILTLQLKGSKTIKPHELMYHVHRMSCFGFNTEDSPWVLPEVPPQEVRKYVLPQAFQNFANNFNKVAEWSKMEMCLARLLMLIYPLYWFYMDALKKRKFGKLSILLEETKEFNLINNYDYEDKDIITIKFSKNKDYTNCYLDFFLYERADLKYFHLTSPFIIYLSGEGSFLRPFYLEDEQIFFRTMFFIINRNISSIRQIGDERKQLFGNMVNQKQRQQNIAQLMNFLSRLNCITCTLDLGAPAAHFATILAQLIDFIQEENLQFFSKLTVQIDLILMLSRIGKGHAIQNQVHILTKKQY